MKRTISWDVMPCSPVEVHRRFGGTCRLHFQSVLALIFLLVPSSAHFSTRSMEATCSSETSEDFQRTTRCCGPEIELFSIVRFWKFTYFIVENTLQIRRVVKRKGSERWRSRSRTILKWVYCSATRSRCSNLLRRKGKINSFACLVTLYRVTVSTDDWRTGRNL
jgi:hypothetical protein